MRISDWSSDVCSSDLFAAIVGGGDVGQAANTRARRGAVGIIDLHAGDARQRFGRGHVGQLADILGDDRIDDLVGVLLDRLRRCESSEEHTSELQSLMRISYAVFCLKKKTQQSKTTT